MRRWRLPPGQGDNGTLLRECPFCPAPYGEDGTPVPEGAVLKP